MKELASIKEEKTPKEDTANFIYIVMQHKLCNAMHKSIYKAMQYICNYEIHKATVN